MNTTPPLALPSLILVLMLAMPAGSSSSFPVPAPIAPAVDDTTDYELLVDTIEKLLHQHLYSMEAFEHPRTQALIIDLRKAARQDSDREAFVNLARSHAQRLPYTHFRLTPPQNAQQAQQTSENLEANQGRWNHMKLSWHGEDVAILSIDLFLLELDDVKEAFEEIAAREAQALILDLRGNMGGTYSSGYVGAHLLDEPSNVGVLFARPVRDLVLSAEWSGLPQPAVQDIESVDHLVELLTTSGGIVLNVRPSEPHFSGPVYVLTDRGTGSASEPLVEALQRTGRATVVGEPTTGAMLSGHDFDAGQGWTVTIPVFDFVTQEGKRLDKVGVAPDELVPAEEALEHVLERIGS